MSAHAMNQVETTPVETPRVYVAKIPFGIAQAALAQE